MDTRSFSISLETMSFSFFHAASKTSDFSYSQWGKGAEKEASSLLRQVGDLLRVESHGSWDRTGSSQQQPRGTKHGSGTDTVPSDGPSLFFSEVQGVFTWKAVRGAQFYVVRFLSQLARSLL